MRIFVPSMLTVSFSLTVHFLPVSSPAKSETVTEALSRGDTTIDRLVPGVVSMNRTETGDFL